MSDTGTREDRIMRGIGMLLLYGVSGFIFLVATLGGDGDSGSSSGSTDITWDTYDVTIDVREDGSLHVAEYQEIEFDGDYSEGFVEIPMERIESIDNVSVSVERGVEADYESDNYLLSDEPDGDMVNAREVDWTDYRGEANTFRARQEGGLFLIDYAFDTTPGRWDVSPLNSTRTIIVEYDAHGVIRDYPDAEEPWQQFHWMAISDEVTAIAPIRAASVTVNLPKEVPAGELVVAPDPGSQESTQITWTRVSMDEGDSFDVQAAFPRMTDATSPAWQEAADARDTSIEEREARANAGRLMMILAGMGIAVAGGLALLYAWYRSIREPHIGPVHTSLSEPPGTMPAVLVGSLMDEEVHPQDIAAGVMDLDRQGIVTISEAPEGDRERYRLTLNGEIPAEPAWANAMVRIVFGDRPATGTTVGFFALGRLFSSGREQLQQAIDQTLVEGGYYEQMPETSRKHWTWVANGFAIAGLVVAVAILIWSQSWTIWAILPLVLGVALHQFAGKLTPHIAMKTHKGAEVAAQWRAFQNHLGSARFREDSPDWEDILRRYMPWMVAFGIERGWLSEMNRAPWAMASSARSVAGTSGEGSQLSTWIWGESSGSTTRRRSTVPSGGRPLTPPTWRPTTPSWDPGRWGDLQSLSDRSGRGLGAVSEGAFSMIGDMLEALGSSSGGGGGSSPGGSSFRGSSSRSGGGRSRSSSGGGRRGFR